MALIVQKFGGTSVGSAERIEAVAEKIISFRDRGDDVVVVVSAMSGETNRLTALAQEMMEQPTAREMDVLLSTGEQVTIALLSMALEKGIRGEILYRWSGAHSHRRCSHQSKDSRDRQHAYHGAAGAAKCGGGGRFSRG